MIGSRSGSGSCNLVQERHGSTGWRACGPEHGLPGILVDTRIADDALQWQLLRPQLLYLMQWPLPAGVPGGLAWPAVARVCALLARRPTVGFRIPALLGMDAALCQQILLTLYRQGCLQLAPPAGLPGEEGGEPAVAPAGNFIQRLWRRLSGLSGD